MDKALSVRVVDSTHQKIIIMDIQLLRLIQIHIMAAFFLDSIILLEIALTNA